MDVSIKDFIPINNWVFDPECLESPPSFENNFGSDIPFILDGNTGRRYLNESQEVVRLKCFLLILGTPLVHPIRSVINISYNILKFTTLSHFWTEKEGEKAYSFKGRLYDASHDLLKIVATPIALLGLELAAIYGVIQPYEGRKLYATLERATYGHSILAPCFQPDPSYHLFGGAINEKDSW